MSDIFTDDAKGTEKDRVELARKAVAEAGGPAIGSAAQHEKDRQEQEKREKDRAFQQTMMLLSRLATPEEIAACMVKLDDLQTRLDVAFDELEEWRVEIEARQAHSEDGTAIYRMEDGRFCTADKRVIPADHLPDDIPKDALTLAEYEAYLRRAEQLARIQDEVINSGREKLESGEATLKDIKEIEAQIDDAIAIIENPDLDSERGLQMDDNLKPSSPMAFPPAP
ncbi:hypothetical protein FF098_015850 [Parvularcula flava]|uniref:Uncharacterized protein n=1 Tax=Aquisalinus luteolus TaxID=1566827 RepID=A0A8J3ESE7_9PROT|nr:hypothetical protein [Aquisalinus luteolus]NHK29389.1 hypothetical protein [Aquisalinus luteolus]GGI00921.1 hypothetical protein GCM10011355_30340 [Aquisalinus luteolus]